IFPSYDGKSRCTSGLKRATGTQSSMQYLRLLARDPPIFTKPGTAHKADPGKQDQHIANNKTKCFKTPHLLIPTEYLSASTTWWP
ncbi:hypothetical protein, partial [Hwanghaeella sp. 1Z406]|uniref:hypothetical protein n=1 Tax=Hwanghaeella sp. 1Z406 TaxID=3402811 RepID=UPI003B67A9C4